MSDIYHIIRDFCYDKDSFKVHEVENILKECDYGSKPIVNADIKYQSDEFLNFIIKVKILREETVPQVGDDVSYHIGSDRYYEGKVVKVSNSGIIYTSAGNRYRRKKNTFNVYYRVGSDCYFLLKGIHNYLDPSF